MTSVFLGANVMSILLLWLCCASTWLSPSSYGHLAVLGLLFPFILIFNLIFLPFWLVFKPRFVVVPLLGVLLCVGLILDYFPLNFGASEDICDLKVVTWNVKAFGGQENKDRETEMLAYVDSLNADLLCFQELYGNSNCKALCQHLDSVGYYHATSEGRHVFCRYPVLGTEALEAETGNSNGMFATRLLVGEDTVVVVNAHLECNFIDKQDRAGGKEALRSRQREKLEQEGKHLWDKLAVSAAYRGAQVDTITHALDTRFKKYPTIVCGDFNDTPISYAYQQMADRLENAFRERGRGLGITYNERFFWIRIDHLFYSADWQCVRAEIDRHAEFSDHYPLVVRLKKRQN